MAIASANMAEAPEPKGRIRSFLRSFLELLSRLLFLKKKKKTASARKRDRSGEVSDSITEEPESLWSPERLNVIDKLWGEGCISPSSAEFLHTTAPLLGLSEKKSLLLLGAGLGGLGRALVEETGVWVTGLEPDEELAGIGKEQTRMTGMQKRAPVTLSNLEQAQLKENAFNTVVSLESLYRIADKEQLYTAMIAALRVEGELLMTDFVLPDDGPPNDAVNAWLATEASTPHFWTADKIQSFLSTQNIELRPYEDITAKYRNCVFKGFFGYLSNVTKAELLEISDDLINECEYWAKQIGAIDSGGLKVYQFHAFKLPEKRKPVF